MRPMERPRWIPYGRAGFGLLALAAVGFLFGRNRRDQDFSAVNFFSYFTIESNLFAAAVLLAGAVRPRGRRPTPAADLVRGAAVLYLATTGVVYRVLLAESVDESDAALAWADAVVHRVMPLVVVGDWLIDPPRTRLTRRHALVWLAYPVAFVAYSLVRGRMVAWYPYPFLDPEEAGGYARVAAHCAGIAGGVLLAAWGTVALGNGRRAPAARGCPVSRHPAPVSRRATMPARGVARTGGVPSPPTPLPRAGQGMTDRTHGSGCSQVPHVVRSEGLLERCGEDNPEAGCFEQSLVGELA